MNLKELIAEYPVIGSMSEGKEIAWVNPMLTDFSSAMEKLSVSAAAMDEAEERLLRFAPFIMACFPETEVTGGLIESPLKEISTMRRALNETQNAGIKGRLLLKMDSHLAVAGSVKARGGIHEILKYAEDLAIENRRVRITDNYQIFAGQEMRHFFSDYSIHVGSTGNLGLSIGIISAALGFCVNVHMSADAKQWKKDMLRSKGVNVIEYIGDYGKAVKEGRAIAEGEANSYFVDDENSKNLFFGYAVAAKRLKKQLDDASVKVDRDNPLFVYIPCGVGGAPGGITFGLKQVFGDSVNIFFVEPTEACCMGLGMITDLHDKICVQDIGLTGQTEADGLAVSRPSKFVGKTIRHMLAGEFTLEDRKLYGYMGQLSDTEGIFIEPSACAAFEGPVRLLKAKETRRFLEERELLEKMEYSTHIVWATGGSLVPDEVRKEYYKKYPEQQPK